MKADPKRRADGTFGPRNTANLAGRPKSAVRYKSIVVTECGEEEWTLIVQRAVRDAIDGHPAARTFLARYVCPPEQIVRVEGEAGDALRRLVERLTPTQREATLRVLKDIDRERRAS